MKFKILVISILVFTPIVSYFVHLVTYEEEPVALIHDDESLLREITFYWPHWEGANENSGGYVVILGSDYLIKVGKVRRGSALSGEGNRGLAAYEFQDPESGAIFIDVTDSLKLKAFVDSMQVRHERWMQNKNRKPKNMGAH